MTASVCVCVCVFTCLYEDLVSMLLCPMASSTLLYPCQTFPTSGGSSDPQTTHTHTPTQKLAFLFFLYNISLCSLVLSNPPTPHLFGWMTAISLAPSCLIQLYVYTLCVYLCMQAWPCMCGCVWGWQIARRPSLPIKLIREWKHGYSGVMWAPTCSDKTASSHKYLHPTVRLTAVIFATRRTFKIHLWIVFFFSAFYSKLDYCFWKYCGSPDNQINCNMLVLLENKGIALWYKLSHSGSLYPLKWLFVCGLLRAYNAVLAVDSKLFVSHTNPVIELRNSCCYVM